ncbi:lysozyme inhibitor LprI family protein [Dyella psychrodurans]|uniref:DUF1311 domain-containing protein n=1 Tax=Dyella psychrodurans TaxID=1927960 RepID=A0A370XAQ9_9GAMM|nr:lysozyme inhibitor LprI family protein [Dyella psychrodurans]RDS85478.1 DUF1311 domain-containing protein [Dyella psychrodurans]
MRLTTLLWMAVSALALSGTATAGTAPVSAATAAPAPSSDACMNSAQSQSDMTACAMKGLNAADKELNQVYQQVLKKYAKDAVFVAKLKAAQKAWLAFRDAELAARFPDSDKSHYGSVYPMCADNELEAMTRKRTEELRAWLKGTEEGDVCAGSYNANS